MYMQEVRVQVGRERVVNRGSESVPFPPFSVASVVKVITSYSSTTIP